MKDDQIKQIQDICWQRINIIEEASSFGNLPQSALELYSIYYFIMTRSFQKYVDNFGLQNVDIKTLAQAKDFFDFPKLSIFEQDVAMLLNQMVDGKRKKDSCGVTARSTAINTPYLPATVEGDFLYRKVGGG